MRYSPKGRRLDGIVTIDDLRQRCYVDEDSGCWHLRGANGERMPEKARHIVWSHAHMRRLTSTQAGWLLSHPGREIPAGRLVHRTCESHDCCAPAHLRCVTKAQFGKFQIATGRLKTPAKVAAGRAAPSPHRKLSAELKQWLVESQQSGREAAHGLGITPSRASRLRRLHKEQQESRPIASVFDFAMRAAA